MVTEIRLRVTICFLSNPWAVPVAVRTKIRNRVERIFQSASNLPLYPLTRKLVSLECAHKVRVASPLLVSQGPKHTN